MWSKYKYFILSFILVVGIFLAGIKLPYFSEAADPKDKTNLVIGKPETTLELRQGGKKIENELIDKIDLSKDISVDIKFKAMLDSTLPDAARIKQGDYIEFDIGEKLKFADPYTDAVTVTKEVFDTESGLKICEVIFTKDTTGKVKVKFDFADIHADLLNKNDVMITAGVNIRADAQFIDTDSTIAQTVKLFGKDYIIGEIKDSIKTVKEGELDLKNSVINWKVTIERSVKDVKPEKSMSLVGYKITDVFNKTGEYADGSFKINNILVDSPGTGFSKSSDNKNIEYEIRSVDYSPADDKGKAVITFSTKVSRDDIRLGIAHYNTAKISKGGKNYITNEAKADIPKFGAKKHEFTNSGNDKLVSWKIDFNRESVDLGNVLVTDVLSKDTLYRVSQDFVEAYYQRWDEDNGKWSDTKTPFPSSVVTLTSDGPKCSFNIPNVREKILLTIVTKLNGLADEDRCMFYNEALFFWNGDMTNYKVKLYGEFFTGAQHLTKVPKYLILNAAEAETGDKREEDDNLERVGFETEWKIVANKEALPAPGNYYLYDTFIYDPSVTAHLWNVTPGNGFSIRKLGNPAVTTLESGIAFEKVMPRDDKHQKLVNFDSNPIIAQSGGITHSVYEIVKGGNVVGHIAELKLIAGQDNWVKLASTLMDRKNLFNKDGNAYNYAALTKGNTPITEVRSWPRYNPKMINKQVLSKEAAKQFSFDYNAEAVNGDIFNDSTKKAVNNYKSAYDKNTHSIIYRISVNAATIRDPNGHIGDFVVEDELPADWKFAPLVEDVNPANNKYFLIYRGTQATTAERVDATVKANAGNYLSNTDLVTNNITSTFTTDSNNNKTKARFVFSKLNEAYVVFLKIELKDQATKDRYFNELNSVNNIAKIKIDNTEYIMTSEQEVIVDERFVWKDFDGDIEVQEENGYLKWNIFYRPYKNYNDNNATKIKIEDRLIGKAAIRKEKATAKLIFEGDNYKIWKGEYDADGNFINPVELTENLSDIFTYDNINKKLVINIPNNDTSYKISYITDLEKEARNGEEVRNEVVLEENATTKTPRAKVLSRRLEAYAYGNVRDFERLQIIKKGTNGNKLKGAKFSLKKVTPSAIDRGEYTTGEDGTLIIRRLDAGEYILKEATPPPGYKSSDISYVLKVTELELGFRVELLEDYPGKAMLVGNNLTITNEPLAYNTGGGGGFVPQDNQEKSENPLRSKKSSKSNKTQKTKKTSESVKPSHPDKTKPKSAIPSYPLNNTPDPNDPNSSDEIRVIGEDGQPIGKFIKKKRPDGKFEYVNVDSGDPLSSIKTSGLPKAGGAGNIWYYAAGIVLVLTSVFVLKKHDEKS